MGVLLVLAVVVLAFLCGRLQVTVKQLTGRMEQLELQFATVSRLSDLGFDSKE